MKSGLFGKPIWSRRRSSEDAWDPPLADADSAEVVPGLVSVVIPVSNGGEFAERAVASVQAQTYRSIEIIIAVDEGSTDESLQIARDLAAGDPRITVLTVGTGQGGLGRLRNHAIQDSRGEFVAFLDQSSWWVSEKLERQIAMFRRDGCAVVYSDAAIHDHLLPHIVSRMTEIRRDRGRFADGSERLPEGQVQRELILWSFADESTVMVRREWVNRVGTVDEGTIGADVYEYLLRIALAGGSFGAVRQPLAVRDKGAVGAPQDATRAWSLWFFKGFSRRFPLYREQWTSRIREFENLLTRTRNGLIRDGSRPLRKRLAAFYEILWLHPSVSQLSTAVWSLLPGTVRRFARTVSAPIRRRQPPHDRSIAAPIGGADTWPESSPTSVYCITGMHRSGTSLAAGVVNLLGADFGPVKTLQEPDASNPRGYWEQKPIVRLNDEVFAALGGSWQDPPVLEDGWEKSSRLDGFRAEAEAVVARLFGGSETACWKDPRCSLLLPFWRTVVPVTATILVYRDPREVAQSLAVRDFIDPERSAFLWLRYVVEAWRNDPDNLRINYSRFFDDLDRCLALMSNFVGLALPTPAGREAIDDLVDSSLRRSAITDGDGPMMRRALDLYEALEGPTDEVHDVIAACEQELTQTKVAEV